MRGSWPRCRRGLGDVGDRPLYCAYCGQLLGDDVDGGTPDSRLLATAEYQPGMATPPPSGSSDETEVGSGERRRGGSGHELEPDPERVAGYRIVRLLGRG